MSSSPSLGPPGGGAGPPIPFEGQAGATSPIQVLAASKPLPLGPLDIDAYVPPGANVLEILRKTVPEMLDIPGLSVWVAKPDELESARPVPSRYWTQVRPKPGMVVVAGIVAGKGGGGGGKSVVRMVASIAVMVAAFYVGGWVGAQPWAQSFNILGGKFNMLGMLASAGTPMMGSVLVNAEAAP